MARVATEHYLAAADHLDVPADHYARAAEHHGRGDDPAVAEHAVIARRYVGQAISHVDDAATVDATPTGPEQRLRPQRASLRPTDRRRSGRSRSGKARVGDAVGADARFRTPPGCPSPGHRRRRADGSLTTRVRILTKP